MFLSISVHERTVRSRGRITHLCLILTVYYFHPRGLNAQKLYYKCHFHSPLWQKPHPAPSVPKMHHHPYKFQSPLINDTNGRLWSTSMSALDSSTGAGVTSACYETNRNKFRPYWIILPCRQWWCETRSELFLLLTMAVFDDSKHLHFGHCSDTAAVCRAWHHFGCFQKILQQIQSV